MGWYRFIDFWNRFLYYATRTFAIFSKACPWLIDCVQINV